MPLVAYQTMRHSLTSCPPNTSSESSHEALPKCSSPCLSLTPNTSSRAAPSQTQTEHSHKPRNTCLQASTSTLSSQSRLQKTSHRYSCTSISRAGAHLWIFMKKLQKTQAKQRRKTQNNTKSIARQTTRHSNLPENKAHPNSRKVATNHLLAVARQTSGIHMNVQSHGHLNYR